MLISDKVLGAQSVVLLAILAGLYACEDRIVQQEEPSTKSSLLEGQSNFRDIGGYQTTDGRRVRTGLIYRSGELSHLSHDDVSMLDSLGVKTIVNFLTLEEISTNGEDRLPDKTVTVSIPMNPGGWSHEAQNAIRTAEFDKLSPDINPEFHRILAREMAEEYGRFLETLVETEGPVVFHCSHGVHRTGTATAIVLTLLGVPWEVVRNEYLLSNIYRETEVKESLEKLRLMAAKANDLDPEEVDMTNIEAFYILQGSYIDATRDYVLTEYGSFENYAQKALGLDAPQIEKLKVKFLE